MDIRIKTFLENVEKQIYTENEASLIRDELEDHILCLVDDYEEAGLKEEQAVSKALLQMGDPREIGYSFTDYEGMKKRKWLMWSLKLSALVAILVTLFSGLISANHEGVSSFSTLLLNFGHIYFIFAASSLMHGHSMKFLDLDTTPNLILWPTKERFKWEYLALFLFFTPLVIMFFAGYFIDYGFNLKALVTLWPIGTITFAIWALIYSERYRIPKYMVIDDGFIIKGKLFSWTAIASYTWTRDFLAKDQDNYRLVLNTRLSNGQANIKKTLDIHKRQQAYLARILREKI